jgi:uncharacterized protein (DUF2384 family)
MDNERLDYLEERATEVLGDRAGGRAWLRQPVSTLDGQIPIEIMDSEEGFERILEQLRKMQKGKVT